MLFRKRPELFALTGKAPTRGGDLLDAYDALAQVADPVMGEAFTLKQAERTIARDLGSTRPFAESLVQQLIRDGSITRF